VYFLLISCSQVAYQDISLVGGHSATLVTLFPQYLDSEACMVIKPTFRHIQSTSLPSMRQHFALENIQRVVPSVVALPLTL
jgi:hypothetical protein